MPWNGQRKLKPCIIPDKCLCSECEGTCEDKPTFAVRCDDCLDKGPAGRHPFVDTWALRPDLTANPQVV